MGYCSCVTHSSRNYLRFSFSLSTIVSGSFHHFHPTVLLRRNSFDFVLWVKMCMASPHLLHASNKKSQLLVSTFKILEEPKWNRDPKLPLILRPEILTESKYMHRSDFTTDHVLHHHFTLLIGLIQYIDSFLILRFCWGSARNGPLSFVFGATKDVMRNFLLELLLTYLICYQSLEILP
jgi:hypothetical protein